MFDYSLLSQVLSPTNVSGDIVRYDGQEARTDARPELFKGYLVDTARIEHNVIHQLYYDIDRIDPFSVLLCDPIGDHCQHEIHRLDGRVRACKDVKHPVSLLVRYHAVRRRTHPDDMPPDPRQHPAGNKTLSQIPTHCHNICFHASTLSI